MLDIDSINNIGSLLYFQCLVTSCEEGWSSVQCQCTSEGGALVYSLPHWTLDHQPTTTEEIDFFYELHAMHSFSV